MESYDLKMSEKRSSRISDQLKEKVDNHAKHLENLSQNLTHANTHLDALSDLAERLRFHVEVKKTAIYKKKVGSFSFENKETLEDKGGMRCEVKSESEQEQQEKQVRVITPEKGKSSNVELEELHFKFPPSLIDLEFLKTVESLIEGIVLVKSEACLGKLAREVKGPISEDLEDWRKVIGVLQKYDDQVRRAIEYFQRQQSDCEIDSSKN